MRNQTVIPLFIIVIGLITFQGCSPEMMAAIANQQLLEPHHSTEAKSITVQDAFTRLDPDTTDPNGQSVLSHCDGSYDAASAMIKISQQHQTSQVMVTLTDARPDTFYTLWLRLRGKTSGEDGETYGGSPITDAGSTPLAPSTALASLIEVAEGPGDTAVANGFMTDETGAGELALTLDFPLVGGAYPFHKADPTLPPLAIVGSPFAPFMIRLVSHCSDNVGHGVSAGHREPWFDWSPQ